MEWKLTANITISVYTVVEASTLEEAIKIAENRGNMDISRDCGYPEDEYWVIDELDGCPQNIHEE